MRYTKKDVLQYIEEEDVKFIRLAFCDAFGNQKNIAIISSELEKAFENGIPFDASEISGFGTKSDLILFPDPATLSILPWRPSHGKVVRFYCDIFYPDGTPYEYDGRALLKKAVEDAKCEEILCDFGAEFEFYLFKTDENGTATTVPYDNAGYLDIAPADKGENVRREICLTLEGMGITPESSHHEAGPGQNEVDFRASDALSAADNAVTFKSVVRTVAARNGVFADFSPKPLDNESGNGLHINIFLHSPAGKNIEADAFMAGIMAHIKEMTVFLNPVRDSYKRLGEKGAPQYITWSRENRNQLIRLPYVKMPYGNGNYSKIELRSPDTCVNPYIAYTLLLRAGLDGIKNKLVPCKAMDISFNANRQSIPNNIESLPVSLEEAAAYAANSDFIKKYIPQNILDAYKIG